MLEEMSAQKIEAPRYKDLRLLAEYVLRRRAELQRELQFLETTLILLSKRLDITIDLNGNKITDE